MHQGRNVCARDEISQLHNRMACDDHLAFENCTSIFAANDVGTRQLVTKISQATCEAMP